MTIKQGHLDIKVLLQQMENEIENKHQLWAWEQWRFFEVEELKHNNALYKGIALGNAQQF